MSDRHACKPMGLVFECPECDQHWEQVDSSSYKCISRIRYDAIKPQPAPQVGIKLIDLEWPEDDDLPVSDQKQTVKVNGTSKRLAEPKRPNTQYSIRQDPRY